MSAGFIIICGDCETELPDLNAIDIICPNCATATHNITLRMLGALKSPAGGVTYPAVLPDTVSGAQITTALFPKGEWEMGFLG